MSYLHFDVLSESISKKKNLPCGDVFRIEKNREETVVVLVDGLGSGITANISANFYCSKFIELYKSSDFSLRESFKHIVQILHNSRGDDSKPYGVITIVRILNNGETTILTYEMPNPVYIAENDHATVLNGRSFSLAKEIIHEINCYIEEDESLLLYSDGVTQSGMGNGYRRGWQTEGVKSFVNRYLLEKKSIENLCENLIDKSLQISGRQNRDDITALLIHGRKGKILNLMTGPPHNKEDDKKVVEDFWNREGYKAVCGSTTAEIVADKLNKNIKIEENPKNLAAPPRYYIKGVNVVTEGAVTLNQVFHIIDEDMEDVELDSGVTQLNYFLNMVDKVNFIVGKAQNPAHKKNIIFKQRGILKRDKIVPKIAEKLKEKGKVVEINYV